MSDLRQMGVRLLRQRGDSFQDLLAVLGRQPLQSLQRFFLENWIVNISPSPEMED